MKGAGTTFSPADWALHDLLVANANPDVEHGPANCPLCAAREAGLDKEDPVAEMTDEQIQQRIDQAVAAAVTPLNERIAEYERAAEDGAIEQRIAEAVKPVQDQLDEALTKLDAAEASVNALTEERDNLVKANEEREQAEQAAAERDDRKAERVEKVKEVASFTDEQLAEKAERWADMSEEAFEAVLDTFRESAELIGAGGAGGGSTTTRRSALTASEQRKPAGAGGGSDMRHVLGMRRQGKHPRTV